MATCELCGKMGNTVSAIVEGSILNVCNGCVSYGDAIEIRKPNQDRVERALKVRNWREHKSQAGVEDDLIVRNFGVIVKGARLKMSMKQDDAAKAIAEKVSVLQKVESGALEPSLKLARKLEQFFGVRLIQKREKVKKETVKEFSASNGSVTIGDLIKFKKR